MMGRRKVVDRKDARACLSSLARSGKTLSEWALAHQIDGRSLRAWQMNLSRGASAASPTRLVELVPASTPSRGIGRYVVRVADGSVEVGDDFDAATLRRLLDVVRSC